MALTPAHHWKLGLFVVLGLVLGFASLVWLGAVGLGQRTFRIVSYFDESVQGLDVGSPVKFRGVPIGSVAQISIAPDRRHVEVTSEVDLDALVKLGFGEVTLEEGIMPLDLRAQLNYLGITGLMFLQIDRFDPDELLSPELPFEPPWNYFPSTPSRLKSVEEAVMEGLNRLPELEEQAAAALAEAEDTLASVRMLIEPLGEGEGGMAPLIAQLEEAATSLEAAAASLDRAIQQADLGGTSTSIREAADAVAEAAHEATGLGGELRDDLVSLREALQSVRALADYLERDPGALLRGRSPGSGPRGGRR